MVSFLLLHSLSSSVFSFFILASLVADVVVVMSVNVTAITASTVKLFIRFLIFLGICLFLYSFFCQVFLFRGFFLYIII